MRARREPNFLTLSFWSWPRCAGLVPIAIDAAFKKLSNNQLSTSRLPSRAIFIISQDGVVVGRVERTRPLGGAVRCGEPRLGFEWMRRMGLGLLVVVVVLRGGRGSGEG